jgi:hypothetical protein
MRERKISRNGNEKEYLFSLVLKDVSRSRVVPFGE